MRLPCRLPRSSWRLALALAALLAGCDPEPLDVRYGRRTGRPGGESVNGTAVLGKMFEEAGWKVASRRRLTPALADKTDCIVWFPDSVEPPTAEALEWFEDWLGEKPQRTLIYVLRDYDAAAVYWRQVEADAPEKKRSLVLAERQWAESRDRHRRKDLADVADDFPWFWVEPLDAPQRVERLAGWSWTADVDPEQTAIEIGSVLRFSDQARTLLEGDDHPLVTALACGDSRVLVVANGSFLLNLPLVNHEHRKLAGRLIEEVRGTGFNVAFLESGRGGPPVGDHDSAEQETTPLHILLVYPLNWILLHLAAAGALFCWARWPIFGRPRDLPPPPLADFGRHVDAVAERLRRAGDIDYARRRVRQWRDRGGGKDEG